MSDLTFLATPLVYLPASSIRHDFRSLVSLLRLLTRWLDLGITPRPDSVDLRKVSIHDAQSICKLPYFPRHYLSLLHGSEIIDISELFKSMKPEISYAYAYGDLLEVSYKNVQIEDFSEFLSSPDSFFRDFLLHSSENKASLFRLYIDQEILENKEDAVFTVVFTSYIALLFANDVEEFRKLKESLKLRELISGKIAIGAGDSTEFLNGPFQYINHLPINPILILLEDKPDYKSVQTINTLLGSLICGGELYNLVQLIEDLATILSLSKPMIRHEIFSKVGRIRLNPFTDLFELYGLKPLRRMERNYVEFKNTYQYIIDYSGIESELVYRTYGISYFEGLITLHDLFHNHIKYLSRLITVPKVSPKDIRNETEEYINSRVKELQEILTNLDEVIEKILLDARTVVQINLAIMTLMASVIISILSFFV